MVSNDKKILIEFIQLYKQFPCLWDLSHSLYSNKEARNQAYDVLLEHFRSYQTDATMEVMKKKIENMRTTCKRERKKVIAARIKGQEHRPTLWYYELFSFILDDDDDNPLEIIEAEDADESQVSEYKFEEYYEEEYVKPKRIKVAEALVRNQSSNDTVSKYSNGNAGKRAFDEEVMAFGRTIGLQLKELDNDQKIIAEKLISDTIFYGRMNKLSINSTIELHCIEKN